MNIFTLDLIGFESLIRWDRPGEGIVPPNQFLDIAEETGMIIDLGLIAIQKIADQLSCWIQSYDDTRYLPITLNLSVKQFLNADILKAIASIFEDENLSPGNITIEITESSIMDDTQASMTMIQEYRSLGINILLDDFGSGYSSLSTLHQYSFDGIKIDQSFIHRLDSSIENIDFVKTIISLGKNLKMDVFAEGIENKEQLDLLKSLGCAFGQGYLISRPLNAKDAEAFLIEHVKSLTTTQYRLFER